MGITRPTGEQLRFRSQYTGDHVLDTYLESSEKGNRQLSDLLDDLFDSNGTFRSGNFEFRFDASTDKIQFRAGNFATPNAGWTDITTFFNITGAFNASTTYNNFDVVTLTDKDVYIVHGLSSGTTFASEAAFEASANTEKLVDVSEAREWASQTTGIVRSTDYSAKAYAIGGTGVDTGDGSAKDWAVKTSGTVGNTSEYSAKYWATSTAVTTVSSGIANINTVAGDIVNVNTVASDIANINTTATNIADVNTVAAEIGVGQDVTVTAANIASVNTVATSISNVNATATNIADVNTVATEINNNNLQTVAADIQAVIDVADDLNEATSEIDTVANSIANVDTVGTNIADVNTVADDLNEPVSEINTVATNITNVNKVGAIDTNVTTVANNDANITTVAGIDGNVTTVAGISADVTTVAGQISPTNNIGTLAGINADITSVAGISANVTTVAGISANVTTVAGISADVTTTATNNANITTVAGISSNVTTVAGITSDVTTVAGISADVTTAATNVVAFNNTYLGAQSSAPTADPDGSALDLGDLYFDTTTNTMKVYSSSGWTNAGSSVNGTADRFTYTATAGQTTFTGADDSNNTLAYDAGFIDIYMNGVKLAPADYTATSGTSVILASGAALNDVLEMIAYGTFTLSNQSINDMTDVSTANNADHKILTYNVANQQFEPRSTAVLTGLYLTGSTTITDNTGLYLGTGLDLAIFHDAGTGDSHIQETGTGDLRFDTNNTTRMRLDQSGNLLVGKASTGITDAGVSILGGSNQGTLEVRRNLATAFSSTVGYISRGTTDGNILQFYQGTTHSGSIGAKNAQLYIGTGDTALKFLPNSDQIVPADTTNGQGRGSAIDLGQDGTAFKDLYLSGGVKSSGGDNIFNDGGGDNDFRVESDSNTHMLFVDAGSNSVAMGTSAPSSYVNSGGLAVKGSTFSDLALVSSSIASGSNSHQIRFYNEAGASYEIARTRVNVGAGQANRGEYQFAVNNGAGLRPWLDVDYGGNVVFNQQGYDSDFRVESNNNPNMILVDGGNDAVGIGTNDIRTPSKLIVGGSQSFVGSDGNFSGGGNRAFIDIENSTTRQMRLGYTSGGSSSSGGIKFYVASSSSSTSAQMALTPEGRLAVGGTDAGKSRLNIQGETGYGKGVLTRQNQVYTFVRNFVNTGSANSSIELCTIGYDHANWNSMWFKVEVFNDYYQSGGESAWILDSQTGTARQLYAQNKSGSWSSSTTQINSNLTRRVWTWNGNQYRSYGMRVTFAYDPVDTDPTAGKVRFTTGNYGGY